MTMFSTRLVRACLAISIPLFSSAAWPEGDGNGLIGFGETIGRTLGMGKEAAKQNSETRLDAPQHIAVLAAVGKGTPEQLEDIRVAIHNSLSSKNFELKRPQEADLALMTAGLKPDALMLEEPDRIAKALGTDGLVYVDVLSIDKTYMGAYASQEVSVRLRLYSAAKKAFVWEKVETQSEKEGGLSLSLFGILTTVVTSTKVLTEGVRQALVDRMARSFASSIPTPPGRGQASTNLPNIQGVFSNWSDGPFRAGDEVIVYMKGEPGLGVVFDLGRDHIGIPMREKVSGEYVGNYVVRDDDNAENQLIIVRANRVSPRASIEWRVPGRIAMDNVPPAGVQDVKARPVAGGIKLTWKYPDAAKDTPMFVIERVDPETGMFSKLAEVATLEYLDKNIISGQTYHYRIASRDAAKNHGGMANVRAIHVTPGPTLVPAEIAEDTLFHALGSPYRIQGQTRITRSATLALEAGTVIELADGASLEVQGGLQSQGERDGPVTFRGDNWRLKVADTGTRQHVWNHTRFEGMGSGIEIRSAKVRCESCVWRGLEVGLLAEENADVQLQAGVFVQNQTGLRLGNAKAILDQVEFRGNDIAIQSLAGAELAAQGMLFDGNRLHVSAIAPLNLGSARFRDAGYEDLLPHLQGPVHIDWRALPDEQNLLKQWSRKEWRQVLTALRAEDIPGAAAAMKRLIPSLDPSQQALAAAIESLAGVSASDGTAVDHPFAMAARSVLQSSPGSYTIWIQDGNLPYEPALVDAPSRQLDEAASRFNRDVARQRHTNAQPGAIAKAARMDLLRHQLARLLLPGERDGAYWRYQVAWLIDKGALERDLRLAGVLERNKSGLVVGLLNQSERTDASQKIADVLQRQKIRFVDMGQGGFTARAQERAREAGVQLVLETRYSMEVGQTKLSSTLKRFDARLALNVYDVNDGLVVQRFTTQGSSSDFRESVGADKALEQAFGKVEPDLLASLWKLDEARQPKTISTQIVH